MFFTLITPVYNIERLLPATIESALRQTFTDWEMILVDDGSPDNAAAICDRYAAADNRIKVIHKPNAGLAAARNAGIKQATGQYCIILEGSDLFPSSTTLAEIHADITTSLTQNPQIHTNLSQTSTEPDNLNSPTAEHPAVDIYFGRLQDVIESSGEITGIQAPYSVKGLYTQGGAALVSHLYDNNDILALSSPVNKAFRRQFVIDNDLWFYEGIYHDDDEWIPRAIACSSLSYFTDRIIYNALTWDGCFGGNVSQSGLTRKAVDKMLIAEHCCRYFAEHFSKDKNLLRRMYTYYTRMYVEGVAALNHVTEPELCSRIKSAAREHRSVLSYMRHTDSRNLRLLASLSPLLGLTLTLKLLQARYK